MLFYKCKNISLLCTHTDADKCWSAACFVFFFSMSFLSQLLFGSSRNSLKSFRSSFILCVLVGLCVFYASFLFSLFFHSEYFFHTCWQFTRACQWTQKLTKNKMNACAKTHIRERLNAWLSLSRPCHCRCQSVCAWEHWWGCNIISSFGGQLI